jgi:DNA-binding beta-propeller fold protein YncE
LSRRATNPSSDAGVSADGAVMAEDGAILTEAGAEDGAILTEAGTVVLGDPFPPCADEVGVAGGGFAYAGASGDLVALCNGHVLVGDGAANSVTLLDVVNHVAERSYPVGGATGRMRLDAATRTLYVSLASAAQVAKVQLETGVVETIPVPAALSDLELWPDGVMFVAYSINSSQYHVATIDLSTHNQVSLLDTLAMRPDLLAAAPGAGLLFVAEHWLSPSELESYAYDPSSRTLTLALEPRLAGLNGQGLVVSPDSQHILFPSAGGSGPGYTIYDYATSDLSVLGEYDTGPYPRTADYTPDGRYVYASNGDEIVAFDAVSHVLLDRIGVNFDLVTCSYAQIADIRVSRGGKYVYARSPCGFDQDSSVVAWQRARD